jgi:hypothetical protein
MATASSSGKPLRPRHKLVHRILAALDADFLQASACFFGGGTRIVLGLGEYRESADIDFLCSNLDGYRTLRSQVTQRSLGRIGVSALPLAREVLADRYGIRTAFDVDGEKIKFEVILEARVALSGFRDPETGVPALDWPSCFAEKLLANADRWNDESFCSRDLIDLAFMLARRDAKAAMQGYAAARAAYGKAIDLSLRRALAKVREKGEYRRRCVAALQITDQRTLNAGLQALAAQRWGTH